MEKSIKEDTVLIVLGASGDLAGKKLFPALFGLERKSLLPPTFRIVGFAPDQLSEDDFNKTISGRAKKDSPRTAEQLEDFKTRCSYVSGHEGGERSFQALKQKLDQLGQNKKEQHRLFYMALPPAAFEAVSAGLKKYCYSTRGDNRLIIEKPFGHDLASSRELQKALDRNWSEDEIFRIDHYLGKEVVNNLLVIRFGNEIFGSVWNKQHIENIEISMCEGGGAEGRGSYYNSTGAIRDIMQNRMTVPMLIKQRIDMNSDMMQILALLTMERPKSFTAQDLCGEKTRVLGWMPPIDHDRTIVGQYAKSEDGSKPAFKDEEDVPDDSKCVTFCAAVARIENERWSGVPILLKAGKALDKSEAIITINFRPTPNAFIFGDLAQNRMTIRVQPDEGIFLKINAFLPDLQVKTEAIDLDMSYRGQQIPEAYEALLLDALEGNFTRSVRADEVDISWAIFTPLLKYLDNAEVAPREYAYGDLSAKKEAGGKSSPLFDGSNIRRRCNISQTDLDTKDHSEKPRSKCALRGRRHNDRIAWANRLDKLQEGDTEKRRDLIRESFQYLRQMNQLHLSAEDIAKLEKFYHDDRFVPYLEDYNVAMLPSMARNLHDWLKQQAEQKRWHEIKRGQQGIAIGSHNGNGGDGLAGKKRKSKGKSGAEKKRRRKPKQQADREMAEETEDSAWNYGSNESDIKGAGTCSMSKGGSWSLQQQQQHVEKVVEDGVYKNTDVGGSDTLSDSHLCRGEDSGMAQAEVEHAASGREVGVD